jgi:hypothetical protein
MTTDDIILHIFCFVDDSLPNIPRHSQAKLYPSELVAIGILFSLKGGYFRAFYRWLKRDYGDWFGDGTLPERTRLQRLLKTHKDWCNLLMADPTFFTVMDSYPIELIFPIREGRSPLQIGKKGQDKGRCSVGIITVQNVGRGFFPLDQQLKVKGKQQSEGVSKLSVWLSGLVPFERARNNTYTAHLGEPEAFGQKVWAEAKRRGWTSAADTQVVGDGAVWIWKLVAEHFYDSQQIVDWYHGKEHLAHTAELLHGEGTPAMQHWLKEEETSLFQGHADEIAHRIRQRAQGKSCQDELLREAGYFEHNQHRMDYLEMRSQGWVIGSGMVESAAKQFKARLAGPGMHWSRAGAERLLPIRSAILSDRFHQAWRSAYNSPPI